MCDFPVIDAEATGRNILRLRQEHGFSVRELQRFFGFEEPRVIYMWQKGQCLPSVDNLYALSALLEIPMNEILVPSSQTVRPAQQQASACCSSFAPVPFCRIPLFSRYLGPGAPERPLLLPMPAAFSA